MKKQLLLTRMLLLVALLVGSVSAWGETYTIGWGTATGTAGTYTNFTTTSGTVTDIVTFSSAKNSSGSDPAYNSSNSELRLYYNSGGKGGSITLTPAAGVTITGAVMTTSTSPSVKYSVDGGTATAVAASSNTYTVTGISATSSLTFQNVNTSNTQLRIKTIQITYTKVDIPKHTVTFSVDGETNTEEYKEGEDIDFPAVSSKKGMKFMGWTTSAISGSQALAPDPLLSEATMGDSDITYYAVFAYHDAGKYILDYSSETALSSSTEWGGSYGISFNYTARDGGNWVIKAYKSSGMQINNGKDCSIKIPTCPSDILSISISCSNAKSVGFSSSNYSGSGTIDYIVEGSDATSQTLDFTGESIRDGYIVPKGGSTSITNIEVKYSETSVTRDYCTTIPTATISLNAACNDGETKPTYYGTYSNASAFIVPADMIVSAISVSGETLTVTNYSAGDVVKAGVGVMVSSATSGDHTVILSSEIGTEKDGNLLKASGNSGIDAASMAAASAEGTKFYRLTMHNDTDLGFYWGAANGAAFDLAANKAYLAVPESLAKEGFSFITGEETDGIKAVSTKVENGVRYNLAGQKVGADYKGIIVVNGKKYLNK